MYLINIFQSCTMTVSNIHSDVITNIGDVNVREKCNYVIVDFKGYICWKKLIDGSYIVDPLFLEEFKKFKKIK